MAIIISLPFAVLSKRAFYLFDMIVELNQLKDARTAFDFSLSADEIALETDAAQLKNAIEIKGKIIRQSFETIAEGDINADAVIECSRCLEPVESRLSFPFKASFVTEEFYTQAIEAEVRAGDLEISIFDGDRIDLIELAREQLLLALPEQIFCREDCKGLCLKCGANRNLIDCNCEQKEIDPRWAKLKELK